MNTAPLILTLHAYITEHKLITPYQTVIVGLSGGPDSVFLLHALIQLAPTLNLKIIAAHLDHAWRPESYKDVQFCQELCNQWEIPLIAQKLPDLGLPIKNNGSQEEIGRKARRFFLETVRTHTHADSIALGHHAQDQQETFFIRLLRGASLTGLTAMKLKDGAYIRPLLHTDKSDILAYLNTHSIPFIIDPSNDSDIYLRNRIRSLVIPALKKCDVRFDANFMHTIQRLQETESFLDDLTQKTFQSIACQSENWQVDCTQLLVLQPTLRYRVLIYWLCQEKVPFTPSEHFFNEIFRFLASPKSRKHVLHAQWALVKKKNLAWVEKII